MKSLTELEIDRAFMKACKQLGGFRGIVSNGAEALLKGAQVGCGAERISLGLGVVKQRFSRDPILTVAVASKTLQEPKII